MLINIIPHFQMLSIYAALVLSTSDGYKTGKEEKLKDDSNCDKYYDVSSLLNKWEDMLQKIVEQ